MQRAGALRTIPREFSMGYVGEIPLRELEVTSAAHLCRLTVDVPEGQSPHTGQIVRVG